MAQITEDYVSFEIAKLLKEKGFDEVCYRIYDTKEEELLGTDGIMFQNHEADEESIIAPTLQMVMKWLREIHHYYIIISPEYGDIEYQPGQWQEECLGWVYSIIKTEDGTSITTSKKFYGLNYEESCKAAIKYCLDHLIVK